MGIKFNKIEKAIEKKEGEYLVQIYEVNEKISQAGNPYFQIKFKTKDNLRMEFIMDYNLNISHI